MSIEENDSEADLGEDVSNRGSDPVSNRGSDPFLLKAGAGASLPLKVGASNEKVGEVLEAISRDMQEQEQEEDDSNYEDMDVPPSGKVVEDDEEMLDGGEVGEAVARGNRHNCTDVNTETFEELELFEAVREEVQAAWALFLTCADGRDAAGEALIAAIYEAAPSIQGMFKTARAVLALRFMNSLSMVINSLGDPPALKVFVETLGFQHMDVDVSVAHVCVFREAIADLLTSELGDRFPPRARRGWGAVMNYVGGAFIFLRVNCAERLRILASSWATANSKHREGGDADDHEPSEGDEEGGNNFSSVSVDDHNAPKKPPPADAPAPAPSRGWGWSRKSQAGTASAGQMEEAGASSLGLGLQGATAVPTTYIEMFRFNAAVMGFGNQVWMAEVLSSFDIIVTNAANTYRLQEECDVLCLRLAKYRGTINLAEYKAVMLASLRSLVPKDWNSAHEVAWSWMWDNVSQLLKSMLGQPPQMELALEKLWAMLDEHQVNTIRHELYRTFFAQAPAGQEFFKQSTTRLYYISDLVRNLTLEIYKDPTKVVEDISGIGLRHVGYGIPVDIVAPFVSAWVQVVRKATDDDLAEHAFRWSLSLIARIMKRVISEGSTIVMKAINANSAKLLQRAVACAPRGRRASWMLNVQVGTQRISPFMWALQSGSLQAAEAIIVDLLTIRADRDRYYYGMDPLFERHPDVVQRLSIDAPALLKTLLDGFIWRSRRTEKGMRRVNYYIKHLVVDANGDFSKALEWLTDNNDPAIACHPVVSLVMDLVWSGAAYGTFLAGKTWLFFCIVVFVTAQAVLNRWVDVYAHPGGGGLHVLVDHNPFGVRLAIFAMRIFLYTASMGRWLQYHVLHIYRDVRSGDLAPVWGKCRAPTYLFRWQNRVSLLLAADLACMFTTCPVLYCLGKTSAEQVLAQRCESSQNLIMPYSVLSAIAMVLYCLLLTDVAVFSTRISAFALVCGRVLSELALFVTGVLFAAFSFAAAISSLEQFNTDFSGIPNSMLSLLKITLGMFNGESYDKLGEYPVVLIAVFFYVLCTCIFLMNLLIAQLSCVYQQTYGDLLGHARLNRGRILVETMPRVDKARWHAFVASLRFGDNIEFGEGDIGIGGGIQVLEPGNANPTTVDMIKRYGGSTSRSAPWPADREGGGTEEDDRFGRLEKLVEQSGKRFAKMLKDTRRSGGLSSSVMGSSQLGGSSSADGSDGADSNYT